MAKAAKGRTRVAEVTRARILAAATAEFARKGLGGARVDAIAARARANKRMIYHYFGSKEKLFTAVLEEAYGHIRGAELKLPLAELEPEEALETLLRFTWDYYLAHPEFLSLVNSANLHKARHVKNSSRFKTSGPPFVGLVKSILDRGVAKGVFRAGHRSGPAQHHHRGDRLLLPDQPLHRRDPVRARFHVGCQPRRTFRFQSRHDHAAY